MEQEYIKDLNIIVLMEFGSHLYGTDTPQSDKDYKGVFLPTFEQLALNNIPKTFSFSSKKEKGEGIKNTSKDMDCEVYSLHYFIKLACEGQTVALDMLHAPTNRIIKSSPIWNKIVENRNKFYTKNLSAFFGYVQKQAAKYGVKGSRIQAVNDVIEIIETYEDLLFDNNPFDNNLDIRLRNIWKFLPVGEHSDYMKDYSPQGIKQYKVCGKILQETMRLDYAKKILMLYVKNYGKRAKLAANNEGIDWKAVSHAIRAALQVRELLLHNTITFPLKKANLVRKIKKGTYDYLLVVAPILEKLIDSTYKLSENSSLPEKVNRKYWDKFIIETISELFIKKCDCHQK